MRIVSGNQSISLPVRNPRAKVGLAGLAGASVYAASKHAVEGLTKSAALEGAKSGVRINAVAPGPTDTGMLNRFTGSSERKAALTKTVPLGRVGDPAEIAHAAIFLASDNASFITGQILAADGGKSAGLRQFRFTLHRPVAQGSRLLRPTPDRRAYQVA